ncbi:uncharacterized protein LOC105170146 [Sesamum indicum]|uniref:Uncharacterized protein LOC105170146 n=1 Tax=Sesamum indicum TaxID=4182 RepID=A0A6I9TRL2_SESIN|nr:uncharacterized protein LOC105170146 [Sesamum indicum]
MTGGGEGKTRIKLFCPSVSKIVQIIACDEQKLDLGSIARAFGLDPNTLKLNGHFISRGVDLVASSVTWKSLIGFFSARGLSTGANDSDALLVDGKLSKVGSKRSHGLDDSGNGTVKTNEQGYHRDSKRPQHVRCRLHSSANDKGSNSGQVDLVGRATGGKELKRKWLLEDLSHLKRTKSDEAVSGLQERKDSCTSPNSGFSCSFISRNMKRTRDEEMLAAYPLKKIR